MTAFPKSKMTKMTMTTLTTITFRNHNKSSTMHVLNGHL